MIAVTGLFSVMIGAILAYASDRCPPYLEVFETVAGILVLGGFAVAGYGLSTLIIV